VASNDVTLSDIARLADVFYIGGTKVGALFGEAVVVTNPKLLHHFTPLIKQHGALLAKGRLLGVQFEALFRDNLYFRIGQKAVSQALIIKEAFVSRGYTAVVDSPTNQQFFLLPNTLIDHLRSNNISFETWGTRGVEQTTVRFVTGWATTQSDIETLISLL
jgi:threonine aldolase